LGADLTALPSTWSWTDISNYVRFASGISTRQGRADEQSTVSTSAGQLTLDNRDGRFSRRNPNSPYFGSLTFNTPIWATVDPGSGPITRMQMFVNEWPTRWDRSATDSTVPIQCAGIMRRLQQGTVLKSPMLHRMLSPDELTPLAYWPCEEGSTATSVGSALVGGSPMVGAPIFGGEFGGSGGSLDLLAISDVTPLVGTVPLPSASGFQIECMAQCSASNTVVLFEVESGTLDFSIALAASRVDGRPHHLSYQCVQNGPNVDITPYADGIVGATTPVVGVLGSSVQIFTRNFDFFSASPTSTLAAHVAVYQFAAMTVPTVRAPAATGYDGELAHVRFSRLCTEESIPADVDPQSTELMGPQGLKTLLELLRECEAADEGLMLDQIDGRLAFSPRVVRENRAVAFTLDYASRQVSPPLEPTDDDQRIRNDITVT